MEIVCGKELTLNENNYLQLNEHTLISFKLKEVDVNRKPSEQWHLNVEIKTVTWWNTKKNEKNIF